MFFNLNVAGQIQMRLPCRTGNPEIFPGEISPGNADPEFPIQNFRYIGYRATR